MFVLIDLGSNRVLVGKRKDAADFTLDPFLELGIIAPFASSVEIISSLLNVSFSSKAAASACKWVRFFERILLALF